MHIAEWATMTTNKITNRIYRSPICIQSKVNSHHLAIITRIRLKINDGRQTNRWYNLIQWICEGRSQFGAEETSAQVSFDSSKSYQHGSCYLHFLRKAEPNFLLKTYSNMNRTKSRWFPHMCAMTIAQVHQICVASRTRSTINKQRFCEGSPFYPYENKKAYAGNASTKWVRHGENYSTERS